MDSLPNFNLVDLILAVLLLYAVVRGYMQGALSQVTAFGGVVGGLVLGGVGAPSLARQFVDGPGPLLVLLVLGLLLLSVLIGQAIGVAIGIRLRAAAHRAGAGWADRAGGIVVGIAGLALMVWLLAGALVQGPVPFVSQEVRESQAVGLLDDVLPPPPDLVGRVAAYLDDQGFPQVSSGLRGGITAPPVDPTSPEAERAAVQAGRPSTVQVQATGCGGISSGSGFVTRPGFVVTNAHVIAGNDQITVRDSGGERAATPVWFDPELDLAVLRAPDTTAQPIDWVAQPAQRGVEGATLGFPGGQREMVARPATVTDRRTPVGRDIYGGGQVRREVLTLSAGVQRGDSGGPFVTAAGRVGGVVFAANAAQPGNGFALTAGQVRPEVQQAINENSARDTGRCRY
jgi:S1-C subfamily serine protease